MSGSSYAVCAAQIERIEAVIMEEGDLIESRGGWLKNPRYQALSTYRQALTGLMKTTGLADRLPVA